MEKIQYDELKKMQKTHWWFCGKSEIVMDFYGRYCNTNPPAKTLDAGCGMGLTIEKIGALNEVYGMDVEQEAVDYCRENFSGKNAELHIKRGSLPDEIPFDEKFDSIVALDVLEHIEDDEKALKILYEMLLPGGTFLATVPALMKMWSGNDELNHHFRRYEKNELHEKILQAGFVIEKISFYNSYLFLPAFIIRKIKNLMHSVSSDVAINAKNSLSNRLLKKIFASEKYHLRTKNFPVGVSLILVAKKPQK